MWRRLQRRLRVRETHPAFRQGFATVRERGRGAPPPGSSPALPDAPGDPSIPPGIRPSLGRFSLLHISPSSRRSYAMAASNWMMASTQSPARSPVPSEAWAMLGRTDLEPYTTWDFPSQSDGHPGAGDASFNGVTPALCAVNLVRRYTRPGDLVADPMAGCYDEATDVLTRDGWKPSRNAIAPMVGTTRTTWLAPKMSSGGMFGTAKTLFGRAWSRRSSNSPKSEPIDNLNAAHPLSRCSPPHGSRWTHG